MSNVIRNQFFACIDFIRENLAADPDVNTITHGANEITDDQKKNIFPLAHIVVLNWFPVQGGRNVFSFQIGVLDIRNVSKVEIVDKFFRNDNELDNLNTTAAVLNTFLTRLRLLPNNEREIELYNEPVAEPILLDYVNGLDGWFIEVQLSIPNRINVC